MCCACFARRADLTSKGCKISPRSLHDDFAGHLRVNRAEVGISSRFGESEGKLLVRIEHLGFENAVRADYRMWNVVAIGPGNCGADRNGQRRRPEAEIINLYFSGFRFLLSGRGVVHSQRSEYSCSEHQCRCQNCNRHTSTHFFSPPRCIYKLNWFLDLDQFFVYPSVESTTA